MDAPAPAETITDPTPGEHEPTTCPQRVQRESEMTATQEVKAFMEASQS